MSLESGPAPASAESRLRVALAQLEGERAAREDAERMSAMKDEFLAIVSHELRSPLGAILGWAHMLRRRGGEEEFDKGLDVIEQSVHLQARLIEELLDMSRMVSGQVRLDLRPVDPRSFIDQAVEAVRPEAEAREIRVDTMLDQAVGPVCGDAARLRQVMVNLLSNAVKFSPKNGAVEVALRQAGGQPEISVADNGIGIAASFLPHVFERFRQADTGAARRYSGLGLGLTIVKHLVELHGGEVRAESPGEGRGSTFVVRLPPASATSGPKAPAPRLPARRAPRP